MKVNCASLRFIYGGYSRRPVEPVVSVYTGGEYQRDNPDNWEEDNGTFDERNIESPRDFYDSKGRLDVIA